MPFSEVTLEGGLQGVRLTWAGASVDIAFFGAHIVSWKTPGAAGAVERLWMSSCSPVDGSAPIRGGIPIAWPQFANDGPLPLHGFAREQHWSLASSTDDADHASASITLELMDSESTMDGTWRSPPVAPFPWRFKLRFTITLGAGYLQLRLEATNSGNVADDGAKLAFTTCFHTCESVVAAHVCTLPLFFRTLGRNRHAPSPRHSCCARSPLVPPLAQIGVRGAYALALALLNATYFALRLASAADFRTADSTEVRLTKALRGVPFVDKVDGMATKMQAGVPRPPSEPLRGMRRPHAG